jgi:hypothetical protein
MGKRWTEVSLHQQVVYLQHPSRASSDNSAGSTKSKRNRFSHPCVKFTLPEGCAYNKRCRFPHICSEKGCGGSHPAYEHPGADKNFRSAASGAQGNP